MHANERWVHVSQMMTSLPVTVTVIDITGQVGASHTALCHRFAMKGPALFLPSTLLNATLYKIVYILFS